MLRGYKVKTNIGIGLALAIWILGGLIAGLLMEYPTSFLCNVQTIGLIPFIYGCCCYAKGKGHSGAWGLLGFLSIIGLTILIFFPDRHKVTKNMSEEHVS